MKRNSFFLFAATALVCGMMAIGCADSGTQQADNTEPAAAAPAEKSAEKIQEEVLDRVKASNIYEVNLRQYSEEGTIKAFERDLPRLKEMGVDILWLMPIYPIGEKNRKGGMGSYYAVKDYRAVNPEHGTMEDFKGFVNKAHSMGFLVILDWVANHTAWDNPMIEEHPDWYTKDDEGNFQPPVADWSDVVDLDYDNPELREYMIESLKFWVKEADIDGYRCDVAEMVPQDFWDEARAELDKVRPVFMLAEGQDPKLHSAFHMTYSWEFHHIMNSIAKGEKSPLAIDTFMAKEAEEMPADGWRMHFITNHDENSWNGTIEERMGDGGDAFAALAFTMPGMPLIYSGQEAGMTKRLDFFEKDVIDWGDYSKADFYSTLLKLKADHPALWHGPEGGEFIRVDMENDRVYAFTRKRGNDQVVVVVNLSPETQKCRMIGTDVRGGFTDVFTGEGKVLTRGTPYELEPWQYIIYEFGMEAQS